MQEPMAFDAVMDEGMARGEARGEVRGIIRGKISTLLRLGRKRFGDIDAVAEAALTSINDLDRLERLDDAILTANSWRELLATP
jgi:hypothetical protein